MRLDDARLERIRGVLLGTALGDATGLPFEGQSPARVARRLARGAARPRWVSDDTEQTALIAAALAEAAAGAAGATPAARLAAIDPDRFGAIVRRRLRRWFWALPPMIGWGTLRACVRLSFGARTGVASAGNGPAMRAAILGVIARDDAHLDALVRAATRPTHTDPRAEDAARLVALAARAPAPLDELARAARTLELRAAVGSAAAMVRAPAAEAARALGWTRGVRAYCVDTVAASLWAVASTTETAGEGRGGEAGPDPAAAIAAAVALGGDTDTTAAIAGAVAGAHAPHRLGAAPWRAHLEPLARALADGAPPPRPRPALLAIPRNLAVGVAMLALAIAWR